MRFFKASGVNLSENLLFIYLRYKSKEEFYKYVKLLLSRGGKNTFNRLTFTNGDTDRRAIVIFHRDAYRKEVMNLCYNHLLVEFEIDKGYAMIINHPREIYGFLKRG